MMQCKALVFLYVAAICGLPALSETMPLPADVIGFDTPAGEALLIGAEARAEYFRLSEHFVTQIHPAYCGPASMAMVLNALGVPRPASDMTIGLGLFDQENIFTPAAQLVKPSETVKKQGMTLDQLGAFLGAHDLNASVTHAGETTLDEFRALFSENYAPNRLSSG